MTIVIALLIAAALHLAWEAAHYRLYSGYEHLTRMPVYLWATMGDIAYAAATFFLLGLLRPENEWLAESATVDFAALALVGCLVALCVEYKALYLHRWQYRSAMPIIPFFGVGLSPIAQMTLILPLSAFLAAQITALL